MEFLPPYSPFPNPVGELFSARRWKVYDGQPHDDPAVCEDITTFLQRLHPTFKKREDIRCDTVTLFIRKHSQSKLLY